MSDAYAGFEPEEPETADVPATPPPPYGVGDFVLSRPDNRWGQVETVKGMWRGVRFGNDDAAVRRIDQLARQPRAIPVGVGKSPGMQVGSTAGTMAGTEALQLNEDIKALQKGIEVPETSVKIQENDPAFIPSFDQMIKSWNAFLIHTSGKDLSWWNIPGKASRSFWAVWEGTDLYNTVRDYREKLTKFYDKAEKILGYPPTSVRPKIAPPPLKDKPTGEALGDVIDKLVNGALIIGGVVAGGWLVLKIAGK